MGGSTVVAVKHKCTNMYAVHMVLSKVIAENSSGTYRYITNLPWLCVWWGCMEHSIMYN